MTRTTKNQLLNFFMYFCRDMGKAVCLSDGEAKAIKKYYNDRCVDLPCEVVSIRAVGGWRLDYAGCYGGWQIQECCNEMGGIRCPFGSKRHSAKDLVEMIQFARDAFIYKESDGL